MKNSSIIFIERKFTSILKMDLNLTRYVMNLVYRNFSLSDYSRLIPEFHHTNTSLTAR